VKKYFEYAGLIALTCFSFYYTEKVTKIMNSKDPVMISIEEYKENTPIFISEIKNHYETRFGPIETKNEVDSISQKEIENNPSVNSPSFNNVSTNSQISTQQNNGMPPINPTMNAFLNNQAPVNTPNNSQTPPNTPWF